MPPVQLSTDVALGVAIPLRDARGRIARLATTLDTILAAHEYPAVIEKLLAEALTLTALLGALLKEPRGQLTLQAQTEGGVIDLLVCDYLGGELRGYVRHDAEKLAAVPAEPTLQDLFGKGYLAITFDQPLAKERYQGIVPLEGKNLGEAAQSYFAQSEQIPSLVRLAAEKRGRPLVRRRAAAPASARGRRGPRAAAHAARPSRLAACRDPRRLGQSRRADRSRAAARRPRLAPVPRGRGIAHAARRSRSAAGAAATRTMSARSSPAFPPTSARRWSATMD